MKFIKFTTLVLIFVFLCTMSIFAEETGKYDEELKKSNGLIAQSLISFSKASGYIMEGASESVTELDLFGFNETQVETSMITGVYQMPDKMYMKTELNTDDDTKVTEVLLNESGYYIKLGKGGKWELISNDLTADLEDSENLENSENIMNVDVMALLAAQPLNVSELIKNVKIVNVFEEEGVKYIDINLGDFSVLSDTVNELINNGAIDSFISEEDFDGNEVLKKIMEDLLSTLQVSMDGFYRINTNTKKVIGIGYNMVLNMENEFGGFPMTIVNDTATFIFMTETDEELIFPSAE